MICEPGSFFPFSSIFKKNEERCYAPNSVLITTAGVRSTFMLPNIGCITNHVNIQRDFNIKKRAPKALTEHWHIFKEIINSKAVNSDWRCKILFFSKKWVDNLQSDRGWLELKTHFLELAWHRFEYDRNRIYYDIAFSVMQKKRNLKPNPYLTDTARHLFSIALGCAPGFVPAVDEESLPNKNLQTAYDESYLLRKYIPTIMHAANYNFEINKIPSYYSLQHPSTLMFSPKSRKLSSTLFEMRELEHIMQVFAEELSTVQAVCADTVLSQVARKVKFDYFHNEVDLHGIINLSNKIPYFDDRFSSRNESTVFAADAKFLRGCIRIG